MSRATETDIATAEQVGNEPLMPTAEQYQAVITDLAHRLQTADAIITALVLKAGGEVVLTKDDMPAAMGSCVLSEPSEDRETLKLRAVQVPQQPTTPQ